MAASRNEMRLPIITKTLLKPDRWLLVSLFVIGLGLRLSGLLFNGMHDLDQIIFEWGTGVKELGLAAAFRENYGVFSYALYGLAVALAEQLPRFWWVPYKAMELSFEVAVFVALVQLLPIGRKYLALLMYWLNPWFILHGAWQGFWEGPHTLLALIAILCLQRVHKEELAWTLAGIFLMASAMFKPQGLVYFVLPVGIYLSLQLIWGRFLPLVWFIGGLIGVLAFSTALLMASGGEILAIPKNYLTAVTVMPNLCNQCINIWRPITRVLQTILSQSGPTYTLQLSASLYNLLHLLALSITITLVVLFSWRLISPQVRQNLAPYLRVFLFLTFAAIVFPQLATRGHINHTYAGLVLLIPLAIANRRILGPWLAMVAIHLYTHLAAYQLGRGVVLPQRYLDYPPAQPLISQIQAVLIFQTYEPLLQFQNSVNRLLSFYLSQEFLISLLAAVQFICAVIIIREMFALTFRPLSSPILEPAPGEPREVDGQISPLTAESFIVPEIISRNWSTLTKVMILLSLVGVFALMASFNHIAEYDETLHLDVARNIYHYGVPIRSSGNGQAYLYHPPLFLYTIAPLTGPLADGALVGRLASATFGLLTVVIVFRLGADLAGEMAGVIAGLLVAISPLFQIYAFNIQAEVMLTALILAGLLAFDWGWHQRRLRYVWLAGVMFGLAVWVKFLAVLPVAACSLFWLISSMTADRRVRSLPLEPQTLAEPAASLPGRLHTAGVRTVLFWFSGVTTGDWRPKTHERISPQTLASRSAVPREGDAEPKAPCGLSGRWSYWASFALRQRLTILISGLLALLVPFGLALALWVGFGLWLDRPVFLAVMQDWFAGPQWPWDPRTHFTLSAWLTVVARDVLSYPVSLLLVITFPSRVRLYRQAPLLLALELCGGLMLAYTMLVSVKEVRHLIPWIPVAALLGGSGLAHFLQEVRWSAWPGWGRAVSIGGAVLLLLEASPLTFFPGIRPTTARDWFDPPWAARVFNNDPYLANVRDAGQYLAQATPADTIISVVHEGTVAGYYADRRYWLLYMLSYDQIVATLAQSEWLLVDKEIHPNLTDEEFERVKAYVATHFEPIARFDKGDIPAVVYRQISEDREHNQP